MTRRISCSSTLALALLPATLTAQTPDLSGEWVLSVEVNGSVTAPSLTLVQEADSLSGTYSSDTLGRAQVRGAVNDSTFTLSFNASMQGQSIAVRYRGEVQEDGTVKGTLDLADGAISGTFTGKRATETRARVELAGEIRAGEIRADVVTLRSHVRE